MQLQLLRRIATGRIRIYAFCSQFCAAGTHADANIRKFVEQIFLPFQRDFVGILEAEAPPPKPTLSAARESPAEATGKAIVFISCGQRTPEERQLGQQVSTLVDELTPFTPYFAENQTTVQGLTEHIFKALYNAAGFIAILHKRGFVSYVADAKPVLTRASVFVEQEIAIAAFVTQAVGRPLYVAAFVDPEIELEGVREHILLNPRQFRSTDQILDHLRQILPTWTAFAPTAQPAPLHLRLAVTPDVAYVAGQQLTKSKLSVILHNVSATTVKEFLVEVVLPKGAVDSPSSSLIWVRERSQFDSDLFRFTESHRREPIYPGDTSEIGYIHFSTQKIAPNQSAHATLFVDGYPPQPQVISLGS